jgi:uncharacterized membrane protein SpoIIM required for sporulation
MTKDKSRQRWEQLTHLLDRVDRRGVRDLEVGEVKNLCRLYRQVTIDLSQARSANDDPELMVYLNTLAARAHGRVYATKRVDVWPLFAFVLTGFPRTLRRCRWPVGVATGVFLLASLASGLAVVRDPDLAYSLFDEHVVQYENLRLEKQQGEYKGNFTFPLSDSPLVAAAIIGNNVRVAIMGFAFGALLCLPGLLLLVFNGRMLGTLSGMLWNAGYFVDFYSLIMTHGVLELSAICISAGGGLRLGWALIAPGELPRKDALRAASKDAFGLLAGSALMLVVAGIIEAFVTPHCSATVRWSVAGTSAVLLGLYLAFSGRGSFRDASQKRPA